MVPKRLNLITLVFKMPQQSGFVSPGNQLSEKQCLIGSMQGWSISPRKLIPQ